MHEQPISKEPNPSRSNKIFTHKTHTNRIYYHDTSSNKQPKYQKKLNESLNSEMRKTKYTKNPPLRQELSQDPRSTFNFPVNASRGEGTTIRMPAAFAVDRTGNPRSPITFASPTSASHLSRPLYFIVKRNQTDSPVRIAAAARY